MIPDETDIPALPASLQHWQQAGFADTLARELYELPGETLPLQQCITPGSYVDTSNLQISLLATQDVDDWVEARVGVFFSEIVASCGCGDDPQAKPAYAELQVRIDKHTAAAVIRVCAA